MLKFIQNIGDYFSSNYFDEDFTSKVLTKTGYAADAIKDFNKQIAPLKDRYFRFKQLFIEGKLRTKDKVFEAHQFHTEVLNALDYDGAHTNYGSLFHLSENEVIPVRHILFRGDQPHLMIIEMQALIKEDDTEADGLFEQRYNVETEETTNPPQRYHRSQWERVFKIPPDVKICPVVINKAISQLFLLEPHYRPKYILLLAGNIAFLLEQEKWFRGSYLQIDLEELFSEATANRNANYYALFYFLLGKETLAPESNMVLLDQLDEDSHKSAYEVTKDLKEGIIHAVEALANEALYYKKEKLHENFDETDDVFEQQVKDDCLKIIYRLLFIFYAESREDLDILPSNDSTYQKGYSLEMLRDLEQVPLYSDSSLNGYFFHESLSKLFGVLSSGYREKENGDNKSFKVRHIDSPLFNDATLKHLATVKFRNKVWQDIICRLSLSKQQRGKSRGRISYANLGINQLGSVYESLLAYRGFYAEQDYIEVHKANEPNEGTYLVPRSRRDDFEESEILKDGNGQAVIIKKGTFVYRLSGRDRQKSASYYTPEVLTQCTVKYTLKPILEKLDKGEMKATELLELKLLEPAMGAAAFHNEMINQLAEAYLVYRQEEFKKSGRTEWKVQPDKYREELQKVKAYIATNNVYGVDLNPTAIELGKLSLWLNVIHKDMETPFFSNRLAVGNAVVGAWMKVYKEKDLVEEMDSSGRPLKKQPKKEWWDTAPRQLEFKPNTGYDKIKHGRKHDEIYHFLLPDKNMVPSASIKMLKEEYEAESKAVTKWKKDWIVPLRKGEIEQLKKICNKIDELLAEYYRFQRTINLQTASKHNIFGAYKNAEQVLLAMRSYDEKERLNDQRNRHNAPYFKLKMVMDYWCSLWFWDVRKAAELPTRKQYWDDIANILELDAAKAIEGVIEKKGQQRMFETANQLSMGLEGEDEDSDAEEATATQTFTEAVIEYANRKDLFDNNQRLEVISNLANQYHFFHPQLEFLEVFWERGGFDLLAGNPPWLKLTFEEKDIIAERYPEVAIKNVSAPQSRQMQTSFFSNSSLKDLYLNEAIGTDSAGMFMNSKQNYHLLVGQQTNLYKCVLVNGFSLMGPQGYMGLLHPEGIYDDPNGQQLRKGVYRRLKYHFQFKNSLFLFSEIRDQKVYSINVFHSSPNVPSFVSINNLLHPSTIDECFKDNGASTCPTLKTYNKSKGKYVWDLRGHQKRAVRFRENELRLVAQLFEASSEWETAKLPTLHSSNLIEALTKLSSYKRRVDNEHFFVTEGWHETIDVDKGLIQRQTFYPKYDEYELVYSGPHLFTGTSFYKTPRRICTEKGHYDVIDLSVIDNDYLPRTNYLVINKLQLKSIKGLNEKSWADTYRLAFRKMLNHTADRTLNAGIIPPKSSHINGVVSVQLSTERKLLELYALTSSIWLDFFIKASGSSNLTDNKIKFFPIGLDEKFLSHILVRSLMLTCITKQYKDLWENNFSNHFLGSSWSINDEKLLSFQTLSKEWDRKNILLSDYSRRWALIELDVLTGMALGMTLEDLIIVYSVQFPKLNEYESENHYDKLGKLVFTTNNVGLVGVGVDRQVWEQIRNLKSGETYEHTITKSELYQGKTITYHAPFDKCDRVEDYKVAWAHFEKVFSK